MPGAQVYTGYGTTLTLATSGFTYEVVGITPVGASLEVIETTHLNSPDSGVGEIGNATYIPANVVRLKPLTMRIHWNPSTVVPLRIVQICRITYPLVPGDMSAPYHEGPGVVNDFSPDEMVIDNIVTASLTITPTGPWRQQAAT